MNAENFTQGAEDRVGRTHMQRNGESEKRLDHLTEGESMLGDEGSKGIFCAYYICLYMYLHRQRERNSIGRLMKVRRCASLPLLCDEKLTLKLTNTEI